MTEPWAEKLNADSKSWLFYLGEDAPFAWAENQPEVVPRSQTDAVTIEVPGCVIVQENE